MYIKGSQYETFLIYFSALTTSNTFETNCLKWRFRFLDFHPLLSKLVNPFLFYRRSWRQTCLRTQALQKYSTLPNLKILISTRASSCVRRGRNLSSQLVRAFKRYSTTAGACNGFNSKLITTSGICLGLGVLGYQAYKFKNRGKTPVSVYLIHTRVFAQVQISNDWITVRAQVIHWLIWCSSRRELW